MLQDQIFSYPSTFIIPCSILVLVKTGIRYWTPCKKYQKQLSGQKQATKYHPHPPRVSLPIFLQLFFLLCSMLALVKTGFCFWPPRKKYKKHLRGKGGPPPCLP